jgi:parvulin-like peptidyl-prolyl isomerase
MRPTTTPSSEPQQPPSSAGPYDAALEGAKPLARVGNEVILASEISLADLNEWIAANQEKIPRAQIEELRRDVLRQRLSSAIDAKLLVVDARRKVPEANMPKIMDHLSDNFEQQELKKLERRAGADNRADLDAKLRQQGTSVERVKRAWMEQQLAGGWLFQQVKTDKKEITHEQMLKYYYDHLADYDVSAKARWEQLMVRVDKDMGRDAARRKLGQMGNDVLRGVSFAEVAKAHSDGPTAGDGGRFDWTSRGSLSSKVLDDALFGLPLGRLSQMLEDERGMYIVRVIERSDAGRKTFGEMQGEIKKAIEKRQEETHREQRTEYLARLKREIPVWTIFDGIAAADATQAAYQETTNPGAGRSATATEPDRYDARRQAPSPSQLRR